MAAKIIITIDDNVTVAAKGSPEDWGDAFVTLACAHDTLFKGLTPADFKDVLRLMRAYAKRKV